jgi:hypothetical protein
MNNTGNILSENGKRREALNSPYNPVTGEGCLGVRVRIEIEDALISTVYLPKAMMEMKVCRDLLKYGSLKRLFRSKKINPDGELLVDFWIDFCELRYRYDFEYFAVSCITIRDKITSQDVPFRLNRGQRKLLTCLERMRMDNVPIRVILLKARQWGGSTLIQLYMYWIQNIHKTNWNSVICAHVKDGSITIRAMYERAVKNMIPINGVKHTIRNYQGTQNIKEIPERGCTITVGTAVEPDSVRAQDAKMAHFSEMAFYPNTESNRTENLETSIVGSIPAEPFTLIARESTANGTGDYFYEEWEKAKRGETAFAPVFVEWFLIDIYSKEFNGYYYMNNGKPKKGTVEDFIGTMDEYEINLFNNNKECTLENINWRRLKRSEMSSEAKMKQEYPSDDIEAFQDSGLPAFRSEDVERLKKDCRKPTAIGVLVSDCPASSAKMETKRRKEILSGIKFAEDKDALEYYDSSDPKMRVRMERDRLKIWEFPDTIEKVSNRYVAVFDPQQGISESADWGVIAVFDRYWMMYGGKPEIVAEWRGRIDKDIAIWIAVQVSKYYNNALLVVESNTYDTGYRDDDAEFIFDTVADYYGNLYSRTPADKIKEGAPVKYGFNTNRSTKPMIIGGYVALIRESGYIERNREALNEARVYEQKKNGSFGAKEGKHDDILMTRMIGCHICYELPLPMIVKEGGYYKSRKMINESSV